MMYFPPNDGVTAAPMPDDLTKHPIILGATWVHRNHRNISDFQILPAVRFSQSAFKKQSWNFKNHPKKSKNHPKSSKRKSLFKKIVKKKKHVKKSQFLHGSPESPMERCLSGHRPTSPCHSRACEAGRPGKNRCNGG